MPALRRRQSRWLGPIIASVLALVALWAAWSVVGVTTAPQGLQRAERER